MGALQCFNYLITNRRWVGKSFGAGIYWSLERVGHSRYNCGDRKSGTSWIVARVISCGIGSLIPSCYFYFLDFLTNFLHFSTFRTTPLYQLFSLLLIPQLSYFHTSFLLLHMGRKCCFLHCHSNYDTSLGYHGKVFIWRANLFCLKWRRWREWRRTFYFNKYRIRSI